MNNDFYGKCFFENQNSSSYVSLHKHALYERIISKSNKCATNHINSQYINLVKEICCKCDSEWRIVRMNENIILEAFSAQDNYLAKLKILRNLALLLSNHIEGDDILEDLNKANCTLQKMFINCDFFADNEGQKSNIYNMVFETVKYAIQNNYSPNGFETEHTEAGRCKYIIFGIIIYLICETIFCRTAIPKMAAEFLRGDFSCSLFDKTKHFENNDFVDFAGISEMIDEIYKEKIGFSDLLYYKYYKPVGEKGIYISDKFINQLNSKYIYNPSFYPQRMEEAELSVAAFISGYTEGFDPYVLEPLEMKLIGFNDYLKHI